MAKWNNLGESFVGEHRVFSIFRQQWVRQDLPQNPLEIFTIKTPNWVTVVPVDCDGNIVLVRQFRFGIERVTIETPGGVIDEGESPLQAAARELAEETGYKCLKIELLGVACPNPVLQPTTLHMFVARDCQKAQAQKLDAGEDCELFVVTPSELRDLLKSGDIEHALCQLALHRFLAEF